MTDTTETPEATLAAATLRDALPPARLTLLSTRHGPDVARAVIRSADGVDAVVVGDVVNGATVAAIGEGVIILSRGGRTERLTLPETR
ncbi:MAG: hypothetical protein COW54_01730 [Rhodobacteraceae bacterium CG17_big_fil_post_rev_8_21_14_2_50_63_15]|nr:hypothetical protein [Roseovarius sp.]PIV79913.1 MAG: hypothetical protein COW54_01730 [Rhodobacteraceae bacterium CG17_big_fil_post_rev_8_21_14_2_50_63_15]